MRGYVYAALAFGAIIALPASAQTQNQGGSVPVTGPSMQNSGTGITGQPGSKSGPASRSSDPAAANEENSFARQRDSSKIPGKPGGKSGASGTTQDQDERLVGRSDRDDRAIGGRAGEEPRAHGDRQ